MDSVFDKFTLNEDGEGKILQLCFAITFFYCNSEDPKRIQSILDVFDDHADMTGNSYRWTQNPNTHKWKKLKNGVESYMHPREWLLTKSSYRWSFIYHAGEKSSDSSDIEFYTYNGGNKCSTDETNFTRIHLPLQVLTDPENLVRRIQNWATLICPDHAQAGFSLAQSHGYGESSKCYEYAMAQRFPGIDVYYNISNVFQLGYCIKSADWLTILSDRFLHELGGLDSVKQRMTDLPVWTYPGGAILQAGYLPQLGDEEAKISLEEYRHVAAIVEPLRCKCFKSSGSLINDPPRFQDDTYREWLARFSQKQ